MSLDFPVHPMSEARLKRLHSDAAQIIRHLRHENYGLDLNHLKWCRLEEFVDASVRNAVRTAVRATLTLLLRGDTKETHQ